MPRWRSSAASGKAREERKAGKKRLRSWPRLENEETALRSNQETDQEESCRGDIALRLTPLRAGTSTASEPARQTTPKRTSDVLPKPDILISYRHQTGGGPDRLAAPADVFGDGGYAWRAGSRQQRRARVVRRRVAQGDPRAGRARRGSVQPHPHGCVPSILERPESMDLVFAESGILVLELQQAPGIGGGSRPRP